MYAYCIPNCLEVFFLFIEWTEGWEINSLDAIMMRYRMVDFDGSYEWKIYNSDLGLCILKQMV